MTSLKGIMEKSNLEDDTTSENGLKKIYDSSIYPRDSLITKDKRFVNIDNGSMGGSHWTCFHIKITDFFTLIHLVDSQTIIFKQLQYPKTFQSFKIEVIISRLYRVHCLYFFYLI